VLYFPKKKFAADAAKIGAQNLPFFTRASSTSPSSGLLLSFWTSFSQLSLMMRDEKLFFHL
jgi:hypothetical protein